MDLTYSAEGLPLCPQCREEMVLSFDLRHNTQIWWCKLALQERVFCLPWGYIFRHDSIHTRLWAFREQPTAQEGRKGKGREAA